MVNQCVESLVAASRISSVSFPSIWSFAFAIETLAAFVIPETFADMMVSFALTCFLDALGSETTQGASHLIPFVMILTRPKSTLS